MVFTFLNKKSEWYQQGNFFAFFLVQTRKNSSTKPLDFSETIKLSFGIDKPIVPYKNYQK
jgi:hypothetical protein